MGARRRLADYQTFGEPTLSLALAAAAKFVEQVLSDPYGRSGWALTFAGRTGLGKTMLLDAVLAELGADKWGNLSSIQRRVVDGRLLTLTYSRRDWRKVSDGFKSGDWDVTDLEEAGLLALDDIGADHDPSRAAAAKLDRVLRSRTRRWTLLTSNMTTQDMKEKLDTRIASFLNRDGNMVVELVGPDYTERGL